MFSKLGDCKIVSSDRLDCREIAHLDETYAKANVPLYHEQQLCPIDIHFILALLLSANQENMLRLMSIDYKQSSASTLHSLPITCEKGCRNRFFLTEMFV